MEITIHTGLAGEKNIIYVDWHDENNITQETKVEINTLRTDKPRMLQIKVNGDTVAFVSATTAAAPIGDVA